MPDEHKMSHEKFSHDLIDFMQSITDEIGREYDRIHRRASEDPGTAGDQGEENWADLIREWLPSAFHIVTKGRIIGYSGIATPQIDILVLKPSYPRYLLSKKLYLSSGVAAAFECKVTLRAVDIDTTMSNCYQIQSLVEPRKGTPYKELYSPIIYGLLAHSHSWKGTTLQSSGKIYKILYEADLKYVKHPRQMLDFLCVADLGTWGSWKSFNTPLYPDKPVSTLYSWRTFLDKSEPKRPTPIGDMISRLLERLAWEEQDTRDIAQYFLAVRGLASNTGGGYGRYWPNTVFSDSTKENVEAGIHDSHIPWNEWDSMFEMQSKISFET
jgi:hypothetical protein